MFSRKFGDRRSTTGDPLIMIVSNQTDNIKKKINNNDKKLSYVPKSMWQFAKEENTTIQTPIKKSPHKPMSMWQMAEGEPKPKPVITQITRDNIPDISMLSDADFVDIIQDNGTQERWTIGELKACLLEHLDEYKRQGNTFAYRVLSQFDDTSDFLPHDSDDEQITEPCEIIDVPDDEPVADFYEFGNHKNQRYQHHPRFLMDGNSWKKYTRTLRNKSISSGIIDFAHIYGFQPIFFTITCDKNKKSVSMSKVEISQKFQNIQKNLKKQGIINFGMKSVETHKSGLYHSHVVLFVPSKDIKKSLDIIRLYVNEITDIDGQNIQKIYKHTEMNVIRYMTKYNIINDDKNKSSSINLKSEFTFFGLPKGIISDYEKTYKSSDNTEIKNHMVNKRYKKVLEMLGAFSNIKNSLSDNYQNRLKEVVKNVKNKNILYWCQFLVFPGFCRGGKDWIYINKYVSGYFEVKNRGPPIPPIYTFSPFRQQHRRAKIMNINKTTKYKYDYYRIHTGIDPPLSKKEIIKMTVTFETSADYEMEMELGFMANELFKEETYEKHKKHIIDKYKISEQQYKQDYMSFFKWL